MKLGSHVNHVNLETRCYFSQFHLLSAKHCRDKCQELELKDITKLKDTEINDLINENLSYATSSVIMATAFLEALINELFQDISDEYGNYTKNISENHKAKVKEFWLEQNKSSVVESKLDLLKQLFSCCNKESRKAGVLVKYQSFLKHCGKSRYSQEKSQIFINAFRVTQLRNQLIHYKPKSYDGTNEYFLRDLLKGKFPDNKLVSQPSANAWFPTTCLGYGCAKWSIEAVKTFADDFCNRVNVTPGYQTINI